MRYNYSLLKRHNRKMLVDLLTCDDVPEGTRNNIFTGFNQFAFRDTTHEAWSVACKLWQAVLARKQVKTMADETKPTAKVVDEYSIAVGPDAQFPTVWFTMKCADGSVHGPFEFVPAYAHTLADELCIAAARTAKKTTGGEAQTAGAERGPE